MNITIELHKLATPSSQVESIGYDGDTKTLAIKFHKGGEYHYSNVPAHIYDGLNHAPSAGIYLSEKIKKIYDCKKQLTTDEVQHGK